MQVKDIIITIVVAVLAVAILWSFINSDASDKYHNDSWKEERRKRKKRG